MFNPDPKTHPMDVRPDYKRGPKYAPCLCPDNKCSTVGISRGNTSALIAQLDMGKALRSKGFDAMFCRRYYRGKPPT